MTRVNRLLLSIFFAVAVVAATWAAVNPSGVRLTQSGTESAGGGALTNPAGGVLVVVSPADSSASLENQGGGVLEAGWLDSFPYSSTGWITK